MARIGDFISTDPPRGTAPRVGQKPTRTRRAGRGTATTNNTGSRVPVGDRSLRDTIVDPILDLNRRSNAVRDPNRLSGLVSGSTREQFRNSGNVDLGLRRSVQRQIEADINPGADPGVPVNTENTTPGRDRVYRMSLGADPSVPAGGNNQIGRTVNEFKAATTGRNPEDFHESVQDAGRGSPSGEAPRFNIPEPDGTVNGDAIVQLQEQIDGATRLGKYASQLKKIIEDPAGQKFLGQMAQAFTARDPNSAGFILGQSAIDQAEGRMEGDELSRLIEGGDPANTRRGIGQESRRAAQTQAFQNRESDRADIGVEQSERQLDQAGRRIDQQDERIELERQRFEQDRDALLQQQANEIETMGVSEINLVNEQLAAAYLPDLRERLENDPRFGPLQELDRYLTDPVTGGTNWVNVYAELQPDERRQFDRMRAEFANQYDPQSGLGIPQMVDAFTAARSEQQTTNNQQTGRPNVDESDMPTLTLDQMEQQEVGVPFIYGGSGRYSGRVFVKNEEGNFVPYTGGQQ